MSESKSSSGLVLWGTATARVMRVHWALHELGLNYDNIRVQTRTPQMEEPAFLAVSPQQKIPVLVDGDLVLAESSAIITYLAERYSSDTCQLIPVEITERALYFQWISFACMELDATALYVLRRHADLTSIYGDAPAANNTAREYFARMIGTAVNRIPAQGYLLGENFCGADIVMSTCLDWAVRYGLPLPDRFQEYLKLTTARPAYAAARAANKPPQA